MNFKSLLIVFLPLFAGVVANAHANGVRITSNKPTTLTYRTAYQDQVGKTVFGVIKSAKIDKEMRVSIPLNNHRVVGIVPVSVDNHVLPASANQFNQKEQCSMATDVNHQSGELTFIIGSKQATCNTRGGVFG